MICRWEPFLNTFPRLFDFFLDYLLFFSQAFCQFWEQCADENLPCILSPYYLIFFRFFFAFFSGFCQFWEQSANEHLPYILSPYYLFFFWLFIVFFSGFLPVLKQSAEWNNLQMKTFPASFPHTIGFFSHYFLFFLRVFASFENNLQMRTFPASFPHTIGCFSVLILSSLFFAFLFFFVFLFWIKSLFFGVCGVCGFTTLVYLIPRSESDTASVWEQLRKILAALWSEVKSASAGLWDRFWRAGTEHESLYAKQTRTD